MFYMVKKAALHMYPRVTICYFFLVHWGMINHKLNFSCSQVQFSKDGNYLYTGGRKVIHCYEPEAVLIILHPWCQVLNNAFK